MQRIGWWSAAVLFAAVAVTGCGGVSPQDAGSQRPLARSHETDLQQAFTPLEPNYKIFPSETGAEIDWVPLNKPAEAQHRVWLPAGEENGKLFVFMPGATNAPISFQYFSA